MAQTDYFLKLELKGLEGESEDDKHKDWIDVLSWSWGASNSAALTSGGLGAGKVMMQELNVVMNCCKATPQVILACSAGTHIPKATLICRRAGDKPLEYLTYELSELLITSYNTGGSAGDIIPVDSFSLAFQTIKWLYASQDAKGAAAANVQAGWNVGKNVKL